MLAMPRDPVQLAKLAAVARLLELRRTGRRRTYAASTIKRDLDDLAELPPD